MSESGILLRPERVSFLRGWNFCTDLYRLHEHLDGTVRARHNSSVEEPGGLVTSFVSRPAKRFASDCLHLVSKMHEELPQELKKVKAMTGDPKADRYGFIGKSHGSNRPGGWRITTTASNILITTHTLKMLLVSGEKSSVHLRCAIASELLDELSGIPIDFFHASSTVTVSHHCSNGRSWLTFNSSSTWPMLATSSAAPSKILSPRGYICKCETFSSSLPIS